MIEFTKGDMFKAPVDIRVNTVNCEGVMGAGVALAFKNQYPEMFRDYKRACRDGEIRPGSMHVWKSLVGDWIINFPTKRHWKDPSRYEDIDSGLDALRAYLREQGAVSVALPALGCGNGGLDWGRVSQMIKEKLGELNAHILVFEPDASRQAGRNALADAGAERERALSGVGFIKERLDGREDALSTVFLKGNRSFLEQNWIGLLPSKKPDQQEVKALEAVAGQLALASEHATVALVYASRVTEMLAQIFVRSGVKTVVILPSSSSIKAVQRLSVEKSRSSLALIALNSPGTEWGPRAMSQAMRLLHKQSSRILLSDPAPALTQQNINNSWSDRSIFYIRYGTSSAFSLAELSRVGALPIGRKADSGEPNLAPLLSRSMPVKSESECQGGREKELVKIRKSEVTLEEIRELSSILDGRKVSELRLYLSIDGELDRDTYEAVCKILEGRKR